MKKKNIKKKKNSTSKKEDSNHFFKRVFAVFFTVFSMGVLFHCLSDFELEKQRTKPIVCQPFNRDNSRTILEEKEKHIYICI